MDLIEIEWEDVYWIHLAQDRSVPDCCERGTEPSVSIKGSEFLD